MRGRRRAALIVDRESDAGVVLLATGPNELWSWDITKLRGPAEWTSYQLYVILDVFSRYVPGWMVAHRESAILAQRLIADTALRQVPQHGLSAPRCLR